MYLCIWYFDGRRIFCSCRRRKLLIFCLLLLVISLRLFFKGLSLIMICLLAIFKLSLLLFVIFIRSFSQLIYPFSTISIISLFSSFILKPLQLVSYPIYQHSCPHYRQSPNLYFQASFAPFLSIFFVFFLLIV